MGSLGDILCTGSSLDFVNRVVDRPNRVSHSQLSQSENCMVEKHGFLFTPNTNKHRTIQIFTNTILTKEERKFHLTKPVRKTGLIMSPSLLR